MWTGLHIGLNVSIAFRTFGINMCYRGDGDGGRGRG